MDSSSSKQNQEGTKLHTNNDDHGRDDHDYRDQLYPNGGGQNKFKIWTTIFIRIFFWGELEFDFDFDLRHVVSVKSILGEPLSMEKINMDQLDGQSCMPGGNHHLSNKDFCIETAVMAAAMAAERGGRGI